MNGIDFLRIENIYKQYPGVKALENVSLSINKGEVHGLVGANGAGKSTLIKILAGAVQPDSGEIFLNGKSILPLTPHKSQAEGIQVIHQDLNLVPYMTVAENVFLGHEIIGSIGLVKNKEMERITTEILENLGVHINPSARLETISVSYQQMVAVANALLRKAGVLVMDETTAAITGEETQYLFERIRSLRNQGLAIIYVSHHIDEIFEICDRISILRDGKYVGTLDKTKTNKRSLISMMVGKDFVDQYPTQLKQNLGEEVLVVKNLCRKKSYKNISFSVKSGEIFGIFGLVGAGRTELVRSIFGAGKIDEGEIYYRGSPVNIRKPSQAVRMGIGLVPEERKKQGLLLSMSLAHNITLPSIKRFTKATMIVESKESDAVRQQIESMQIMTPGIKQIVRLLSGGNQQKAVLAKWLVTKSKLLILDQPTRGIDVRAKSEIYMLMRKLVNDGHAIIMISDELPEILGMSDRILVIHEGCVTGVLDREEASQEKLLHLAYGENI